MEISKNIFIHAMVYKFIHFFFVHTTGHLDFVNWVLGESVPGF